MLEDALVEELRELADTVFPETPPLVDTVIAGLAAPTKPRRRWKTAVAVTVVVILAVLSVPAPREALARLLGIGGVTIERVEEYDFPETVLTAEPLGSEVELGLVADLVGFRPRLPTIEGVTDPTVFVRTDVAEGLVSLVYRNRDEPPGLIITQFRTAGEVAIKQLTESATFREVVLEGSLRAFWIEGTHTIAFLGDSGVLEDSARLVGNTLIWQDAGITYRIESALALDEVLAIARSM